MNEPVVLFPYQGNLTEIKKGFLSVSELVSKVTVSKQLQGHFKLKNKSDGWKMEMYTSSHFTFQNNSKCLHFNYFGQSMYFRFIEFGKVWLNVMKNWKCIYISTVMK